MTRVYDETTQKILLPGQSLAEGLQATFGEAGRVEAPLKGHVTIPVTPLSSLALEWQGRRDGAMYSLTLSSLKLNERVVRALHDGKLTTAMTLPGVIAALRTWAIDTTAPTWELSFCKGDLRKTLNDSSPVSEAEALIQNYHDNGWGNKNPGVVVQRTVWSETDAITGHDRRLAGTYCRYGLVAADDGTSNFLAVQAEMRRTEWPTDVLDVLEGKMKTGAGIRTLVIEAYEHAPGQDPYFKTAPGYPTRLWFEKGVLTPLSGEMAGTRTDDVRAGVERYMSLTQTHAFSLDQWQWNLMDAHRFETPKAQGPDWVVAFQPLAKVPGPVF